MADNLIFSPNKTAVSQLTETPPPIAQALSLNQAQDPFKIAGEDTYKPNPGFTLGGEGFMDNYNDFVSNPEKNLQKRTIEAFLDNNKSVDERNLALGTDRFKANKTSFTAQWVDEGIASAQKEKIEKKKHPLGLFFEQYGRDVTSVYSGVALDVDRTNHYMERWATPDPVTGKSTMDNIKEVIAANEGTGILRRPEDLAEQLTISGVFKSEAEKAFFLKNAHSKYGAHDNYGTSLYQALKAYVDPSDKSPDDIANLIEDWHAKGYTPDFNNPKDLEQYKKWETWHNDHPDWSITKAFKNAKGVAGALYQSLIKTGAGIGVAVGSDLNAAGMPITVKSDPTLKWKGDFVDAKGENLTLKNEIVEILRKIRDNDPEAMTQFNPAGALSLIESKKGKGEESDLNSLDPTQISEIPKLWTDLAEKVKVARERGGIVNDAETNSITALTTVFSSIVGSAMDLTRLAFNPEPNSVSTMIANLGIRVGAGMGAGNGEYSPNQFSPEGAKRNWSEASLYLRARRTWMASQWSNTVENVLNNGLVPDSYYDKRWGRDSSYVFDVFTGGKGLIKIAGKLGRATGLFEGVAGILNTANLDATLGRLDQLAANGVNLDVHEMLSVEQKAAFDAVKKRVEITTGKPASAIDVFKEMQINPEIETAPGVKTKIPNTVISQIAEHITNKLDDTNTLRQKVLKVVGEGRLIKYTDEANKTMTHARAMLQAALPEMDVAKIPDFELYMLINDGKIPFNQTAGITSAEWINASKKLKGEVGDYWRKIEENDILGYTRNGTLPKFFDGFNTLNPTGHIPWAQKLANFLGYGKQLGKWALKKQEENIPIAKDARASARFIPSEGGPIPGQQSVNPLLNSIRQYEGFAHLARAAGALGDLGDFIIRYNKAVRTGKSVGGSAFLGVQAEANQRIAQIDKRLNVIHGNILETSEIERANQAKAAGVPLSEMPKNDPLNVGDIMNKDKEIAKLVDERNMLSSHSNFAKKLHLASGGAVEMVTEGMSHAVPVVVSNELFAHLGSEHWGAGLGGVMYGTPVNYIWAKSTRNFGRMTSTQERMNQDTMDIHHQLAYQSKVQQMAWLDLVVKEKRKAEELAKTHNPEVAQRSLARGLSTINQLMRMGNVEIHEPGVGDGLIAILRDTQHLDAQTGKELINQFMEDALKLNLTGDAARNHAISMVDNMNNFNAVEARRGKIAEEIGVLKAERDKLAEETHTNLHQHLQGLQQLAAEAGMDMNNLQVSPESSQILINGLPVGETTPDVRRKLKALQDEIQLKRKMYRDNHAELDDLNGRIDDLHREAAEIGAVKKIREYRDGEVIMSQNPDSYATRFSNGVTVWMDNGNPKIILSNESSVVDRHEEIAHALFTSMGNHEARPMILAHLFGKYDIHPETNQPYQVHPPSIGDGVITNWDIMRTFAQNYANKMNNKYDAAMFMAQFNIGEANFKKNPLDYRFLYPVIMELHGNVYKQRQMMLDPWGKATMTTPTHPTDNWEQTPIQVGSGSTWKPGQDRTSLFYKIVFGNLTFNEYMSHMAGDKFGPKQADVTLGNPMNIVMGSEGAKNLSELNRIIDPNTNYTVYDAMMGFAKFNAVWGPGRGLELLMLDNTNKRLQSMGFIKNNNTSPDPSKSWKYGQIVDERGMPIDSDPEMQRFIDIMQAHSRGNLKKPDPDAMHNLIDIFQSLNDQSEGAKNTRIAWAQATGKQNWLERDSDGQLTGNLKGTLPELTMTDIEGATQTMAMLIEDKKVKGTELTASQFLNLKLVRGVTNKNGLVFSGTPTKEAIPDLVKWLYPKISELNYENHAEVQHTMTLLTAIANANIFNPQASSAGSTAMFVVGYNGATVGKGPTVTGSVKNNMGTQLRVFTPLMFMVEETAIGKDGKIVYDSQNQPLRSAQAYFYVLDNDALMARTTDAYRGTLLDSKGKKYFKAGEIADKFGGFYNFNEAVNLVLRNYQAAGTVTGKFENIPERSWKVLLPMADGNEALARHLSDVVNRAIGFPDTNFNEWQALEAEKKKKGKLNKEKSMRLEQLQSENIGMDIIGKPTEQEALALLGAQDRNELGASPMWSTRMAFCKIRADRIETMVSFQDKFGNGYFPMTASGYKFGQIAHAANSWNEFTPKEVKTTQGTHQLGAGSIVAGLSHPSGYTVLELSYPQTRGAGGKFGAASQNKIVLFDPLKNEVKSGTTFKTMEDATIFAREHAQKSNQQAGVNTVLEPAMIKVGFNPRGIEFKGEYNLRGEYYHNDGTTKIVRNKNNTFDMVDIQSGATLASGIKVSVLKGGKIPDVSNLQAAYNDANKGNTRHVAINDHRIEQLGAQYEQGVRLAEYRKILGNDGRNTNVMLFQNNPLYYEFKQRLIRSCGHAEAAKTLELMRQELGEDILNADYSGVNEQAVANPAQNSAAAFGATAKWISDFTAEKHWDTQAMAQELHTTLEKENAARSAAQVIAETRDRQKPSKPYMPKQPVEPIMGEKPNDTVEDYNARTAQYAKELLAYQDAETFGPTQEQRQLESIDDMIKWTKGLINSHKKYVDIAKTQKGFIPEGNPELDKINAALHKNRVSLMADVQSGRVEAYINNAGYIIQQLVYKAPTAAKLYGQQVKFTGQNNMVNKFVLYNPSIQAIVIADSMEEANDAALVDILGTPEEKAAARKERLRKAGRQIIKDTVDTSYEKQLDYKKYQNTK